jgi:hypothetical protein
LGCVAALRVCGAIGARGVASGFGVVDVDVGDRAVGEEFFNRRFQVAAFGDVGLLQHAAGGEGAQRQ